MVEQTNRLNFLFGALSNPTRRDILKKVSKRSLSVSAIATHYSLTFAAVAKHLDVLRRAKLITKARRGKEQIVSISPGTLAVVSNYLENLEQIWENRLDSLGKFLKSTK